MPGLPQGPRLPPRTAPPPKVPDVVDLTTIAKQLSDLIDLGKLLVDALYDNALLTNPKAFAVSGEAVTPAALSGLATATTVGTTGVSLYKNNSSDPVMLYARLQGLEDGEIAFIYLAVGDSNKTTVATARFASSGPVPEASVLVPAGLEVFVNGTAASSGLASATVVGFTVPLAGRTIIYPNQRGGK